MDSVSKPVGPHQRVRKGSHPVQISEHSELFSSDFQSREAQVTFVATATPANSTDMHYPSSLSHRSRAAEGVERTHAKYLGPILPNRELSRRPSGNRLTILEDQELLTFWLQRATADNTLVAIVSFHHLWEQDQRHTWRPIFRFDLNAK